AEQWARRQDALRAQGVARDYLGTIDRRTRGWVPKLRLNDVDSPIFEQILSLSELGRDLPTPQIQSPESHMRLLEAASHLRVKLTEFLAASSDADESLLGLEEFLSEAVQ